MKHAIKRGALLLALALSTRLAHAEPPKTIVLPPIQPLLLSSTDSVPAATNPIASTASVAPAADAAKTTDAPKAAAPAPTTPASACATPGACDTPGTCATSGTCTTGSHCCFSNCCLSNACCFTDGCEHGKLIGGVGVYLLQPYFSNNPAMSAHVQSTGPETRNDIQNHISAAPLIWLGFMNNDGLGVRGRWWSFRQSTDQTFDFGPGNGGLAALSAEPLGSGLYVQSGQPYSMEVTSKLELQVVDLEVFQDTTFCNWNFLFAGGVSYGDIMQDYGANLAPFTIHGSPVNSHTSFVGFGPVLALEARRPVGCCGLNIYGSTRTRILYGNRSQIVSGGDELHGNAVAYENGLVAVEELELGLEYARTVGKSRLFGQIAMVGQEWFGGGNSSNSSFSGPKTSITQFSTQDTSNFGLFGLAFRLGLNY